ncbi:MAG: purine-binding chemotaxis protein CheW [Paraglaciecola sp.]|jgi:purine-binding chemotaxis protein CheW
MSGRSFANEDVMEDYMSELLSEETVTADIPRQTVARLLDTAEQELSVKPTTQELIPIVSESRPIKDLRVEAEKEIEPIIESGSPLANNVPEREFQALFFEVAGLTLAVQLTDLGGIHELENVTPLIGKPIWFKGVMLHRQEKYNVVDTARWIMPGKFSQKMAESTKYQYLILLDKSGWGLACESLFTTSTLQVEDVKWRKADSKRPWLAGMVKNKMCALVNVQQLVSMLNKGLNSND